MRERLPIELENNELPVDDFVTYQRPQVSYGFVNILYILSLLITAGSVLVVIFLGNR